MPQPRKPKSVAPSVSDNGEQPSRPARGRHAPPPEVRIPLQRRRLLRAAAAEFAERGYAAASATSVARRAGMSKATFYAHFDNKEDCILALYDRANQVVTQATAGAANAAGNNGTARLQAATRAYLLAVAQEPEFARVLVVEILAAGPRALAKRDQAMQLFADVLDAENAAAATRGATPRFASPHDAFAIVGAITELVSRCVRCGEPRDLLELAPVIDRLIEGVLARGAA
jgi:AcrR family transcriptional regulator